MRPYIAGLTLKNLEDVTFDDFQELLAPYLLEEIPEGTLDGNPDRMLQIDRLIGRLANIHAYLAYLYGYAAARAQILKSEGRTAEWGAMLRKKDALYEYRGAVKLKWNACSRMVTINLGIEDEPDDHIDHHGRAERMGVEVTPAGRAGRQKKANARPTTGWDAFRDK